MTVFLTDFGDSALVLGMLVVVAGVAGLGRWYRGAACWLAAAAATLGTVLLLKVVLLTGWVARGYGTPVTGHLDDWSVRSPSGHTASSVLVYGGLLVLLGAPALVWVAVALLAGLVVGATRVALGTHSVAEGLVGGAVGLLGVLAMAGTRGPAPLRRVRWALAAAGLVTIVALHGWHLNLERGIEAFALRLAQGRVF